MGEERSVEQLWQALDGATGRDRLEVLGALATGLHRRGDYQQALSLAEVACTEADVLDAFPEMVDVRLLRGRVLFALAEFDSSAACHREAAVIAGQHLDDARLAVALTFAGESLSRTDQLREAADLFGRAEAVAQGADLTSEASRAGFMRGRVLLRLDENVDALAALDRARAGHRALGNATEVLEIDDARATVLLALDRVGDAVEVLRARLHVVESVAGDVPYAQQRLGGALRRAGEPAAALPLLESAAQAYAKRTLVHATGECLLQQALCHRELDDMGEAFAALARARAHLDAAGRDEAVVWCDVYRALWLHASGDYQAAAALNRRLLDDGDAETAASARWRLAENEFSDGRTQAAAEILDEWPPQELSQELTVARIALAARVLLACDRPQEALAAAIRGLGLADDRTSALHRAWLYDVRAQLDRTDVTADRAHAIALYLAAGQARRARELSTSFLPTAGPAPTAPAEHDAPDPPDPP